MDESLSGPASFNGWVFINTKTKIIMADYFTNFSIIMPLPDEAAQKYALQLEQTMSNAAQGDELPDDIPEFLRAEAECWLFETEPADRGFGLWLHSQHGGIDAVCAFIQHLLQKFDPAGRVPFEWSHDCSKPRVDAFGGGAAIITAEEIKSICTNQWLQEQAVADAQAPA